MPRIQRRLVFLSCMELQQGCVLHVLWGTLHVSSSVAFLHSLTCSCRCRAYSQWLLFFSPLRLYFSCNVDGSCLFIHRIGTKRVCFPHPPSSPSFSPLTLTPPFTLLGPPTLNQKLKWRGPLQVKEVGVGGGELKHPTPTSLCCILIANSPSGISSLWE